jgi:hypothetical protein
MKNIEFRGQHPYGGKPWITGLMLDEKVIGKRKQNSYTKEWHYVPYEVIPDTIGQFTGLTDKKGVKWFEDDVLKNPDKTEELIICFVNGGFGYWLLGDFHGFAGHLHLDGLLEIFTPDGTIHDK